VHDVLGLMCSKMQKYARFFAYGQFIAGTKETRTAYLHFLSGVLLRSAKNETLGDMLALMERIVLIEKSIVYYEDSILLGSLRSMMECARQRIRTHLETLPIDVHQSYVIARDGAGGPMQTAHTPHQLPSEMLLEDAEVLACQEADSACMSRLALNDLDEVFTTVEIAAKLNKYFRLPRITAACNEAASTRADYCTVKEIYRRYRSFLLDDGFLYRSQVIEGFLHGLANLRWRHAAGSLTDEKLKETKDELTRLEISQCLFTKLFGGFVDRHLVEMYKEERSFISDPAFYLQYFTHASFDRSRLLQTLGHRMPAIAGAYCDIVIDRLTRHMQSLDLCIKRHDLFIDTLLFEGYHHALRTAGTIPADLGYLKHMHELSTDLPPGVERKRRQIEQMIADGWTNFCNQCFGEPARTAAAFNRGSTAYIDCVNKVYSYLELFRNKVAFFNIILTFTPSDLLQRRSDELGKMARHAASTIEAGGHLISTLKGQQAAAVLDPLMQMAYCLESQETLHAVRALYDSLGCAIQTEEVLAGAISRSLPGMQKVCDDTGSGALDTKQGGKAAATEEIRHALDKYASLDHARLHEIEKYKAETANIVT